MRNILLATTLLSIASVALAKGQAPAPQCGYNSQHCTSFVDQLEHPSTDGYRMQHSLVGPSGEVFMHEGCVNADLKLTFKAKDPGAYTEKWKIERLNEAGELVYEDYATQTFFVREGGIVLPPRHEVFIDSTKLEANCTFHIPSDAEKFTEISEG